MAPGYKQPHHDTESWGSDLPASQSREGRTRWKPCRSVMWNLCRNSGRILLGYKTGRRKKASGKCRAYHIFHKPCSSGARGGGQKESLLTKTFGLSTLCDNQASMAKGSSHSTIQSFLVLVVFVIIYLYMYIWFLSSFNSWAKNLKRIMQTPWRKDKQERTSNSLISH